MRGEDGVRTRSSRDKELRSLYNTNTGLDGLVKLSKFMIEFLFFFVIFFVAWRSNLVFYLTPISVVFVLLFSPGVGRGMSQCALAREGRFFLRVEYIFYLQ